MGSQHTPNIFGDLSVLLVLSFAVRLTQRIFAQRVAKCFIYSTKGSLLIQDVFVKLFQSVHALQRYYMSLTAFEPRTASSKCVISKTVSFVIQTHKDMYTSIKDENFCVKLFHFTIWIDLRVTHLGKGKFYWQNNPFALSFETDRRVALKWSVLRKHQFCFKMQLLAKCSSKTRAKHVFFENDAFILRRLQ